MISITHTAANTISTLDNTYNDKHGCIDNRLYDEDSKDLNNAVYVHSSLETNHPTFQQNQSEGLLKLPSSQSEEEEEDEETVKTMSSKGRGIVGRGREGIGGRRRAGGDVKRRRGSPDVMI